MNRETIFWGFVLILVGGLLLLSNLGIITINVWQVIGPLLMILFGFWILLGTLSRRSANEQERVVIPLEGASSARVRIDYGAGRLLIQGGEDIDELADGLFTGGLDYRSRRAGERLEVQMGVPKNRLPSVRLPIGGFDWSIRFKPDIPLYFDINTGANESEINLEDLLVQELRLATGASSTLLTLPGKGGFCRAVVESGAASVKIFVPDSTAARITIDSGLTGIQINPDRYLRKGNVYESAGYEAAENKVDLEVRMGVGSLSVD